MEIDNLNRLVGSGISIYSSRERIRRQLVDFAQSYLELETVDFYKTSVLSYLIDTISILTANHLFYDSMIYREFFFVDAQLKDSVYNLAKWIGYEIPKAVASTVDIMFTIPLTFSSPDVFFTVPNNFMAYAEDIPFRVDSRSINVPSARFNYNKTKFLEDVTARGIIINNSALSIRDSDGFYRPIFVNENENGLIFASFTLPFTQHERIIEQFHIPETIQPYQFFSKKIKFEGMVSGVRVWVIEPGIGEKIPLDITNPDDFDQYEMKQSYISGRDGNMYRWTEWKESSNGIYTLSSNSQQFIFVGGINQCEILFGNGIVGRQPIRNSAVTIELFITKGEEGHIIPNSITKSDELKYSILARQDEDGMTPSTVTSRQHSLNFQITNPIHSQGGVNTPTLPEIKRNAIVNLRSKGKLVSDSDYDDINIIMGPSFPTVQAYPILKRSDIKTNEIMAFILLQYYDEEYLPQIVPTRNSKLYFDNPPFNSKGEYTIMRTSSVIIDDEKYETLFNVTMNKNNRHAKYDYVLQNVKGSPSILYNEDVPSFYQQYAYIPVNGIDFDIDINYDNQEPTLIYDSTHSYPLNIRVNVNHIPQDEDSDYYIKDFRCKLVTKWGTQKVYEPVSWHPENPNLEEGEGYQWFDFQIDNYLEVPPEIQRYEFIIEILALRRNSDGDFIDENGILINESAVNDNPEQFEAWQPLIRYYCDALVRKDLSDVMNSPITRELINTSNNSYRYYIHNVPVILSRYLDDGDGGGIYNRSDNSTFPNFESSVIQPLISNLNLHERRMITDFVNIKFPDTYGPFTNLKYNPVDHTIESRYRTPFNWESPDDVIWNTHIYPDPAIIQNPSNVPYSNGMKFIVNGKVPNYETAGKPLSGYLNYIAEYYEGAGWYLTKPAKGTYVKVRDELDSDGEQHVIIFDGDKWLSASKDFKIPLLIDLKIEIDKSSTVSSDELKNRIRSELIDHFSPYMGIHRELDRSEISAVVRKVPGVVYCEVKKPEVDIRFKYDIRDLTQKQLIDYTPQYTGVVSNYRNYSADSQDDGIQIEIIK